MKKNIINRFFVVVALSSMFTVETFASIPNTFSTNNISIDNIDNMYSKITIDLKEDIVLKDGEQTSLSKEFNISNKQEDKLLDSKNLLEDFVEDNNCEIKIEDNVATIRNLYQTKKLLVIGDIIDNYNAINVEKLGDTTILSYKTEDDTRNAYEQLSKDESLTISPNEIISLDTQSEQDSTSYNVSNKEISIDTQDSAISNPIIINPSKSWGTSKIGLDKFKDTIASLDNESKNTIKVGIIDTGLDLTNKELAARVDTYRDFIDEEEDTNDYVGHGTHVSGIVMDGTASNVKLVSYKIFNAKKNTSLLALVYSLHYAIYEDKVDVINMSLGQAEDALVTTYIDDYLYKAYTNNIPICCSTGNNHTYSYNNYPSNSAYTISVSSLPSEENEILTFGDGIDYVAPGFNIVSTFPTYLVYSSTQQMVGTPYFDEDNIEMVGATYTMSGTSMSCPHIVAAIADILSVNKDLTIPEIKSVLNSYSDDLGDTGKDDTYGYGMPNFTNLILDKNNIGTSLILNGLNNDLLTEYKETDKESNEDCKVYVTQSSEYSVIIPKVIILDGLDKQGIYVVSCLGDIAGNETLRVYADKDFIMSQFGKNDITANITQEKFAWTYTDLINQTKGVGTIDALKMTAGSWFGKFNFSISLKETATIQ